jgi:hypothetical protein
MKTPVGRMVSHACYWICEWLSGHSARRTSSEMLNAASAIAAVEILDVARLVKTPEERIPILIRQSLPAFTADEWREVLALAREDRAAISDGLSRHPEWENLRRVDNVV